MLLLSYQHVSVPQGRSISQESYLPWRRNNSLLPNHVKGQNLKSINMRGNRIFYIVGNFHNIENFRIISACMSILAENYEKLDVRNEP